MNNTNKDCYVYSQSNVWAQYNYWGGGAGNYYKDASSTLHTEFYLEDIPFERSLNRPPESEPLDIISGLELERANDISNAVSYYQQMISNNSYPGLALTRLAVLKKKYSLNNVQTYLNNLANSNSAHRPLVLNLLASLSLSESNYSQALNYYNLIIQGYSNSSYSTKALFEKFYAAVNFAKDMTTASQLLTEIRALNLTDEEYLMSLASVEALFERINSDQSQNFNKNNKVSSLLNIPTEYGLYQNYPNPFNPMTTIRYDLPKDSRVSLVVYNIAGQEIKTLVSKEQQAGRYEVQFNATSMASGVYIYRLQAGEFVKVHKMSLIK